MFGIDSNAAPVASLFIKLQSKWSVFALCLAYYQKYDAILQEVGEEGRWRDLAHVLRAQKKRRVGKIEWKGVSHGPSASTPSMRALACKVSPHKAAKMVSFHIIASPPKDLRGDARMARGDGVIWHSYEPHRHGGHSNTYWRGHGGNLARFSRHGGTIEHIMMGKKNVITGLGSGGAVVAS
jgi:hypothetical protein